MMDWNRKRQIINACLVVAVGCALFFDEVGSAKWLLGVLAILAGVIAAAIHFQTSPRREDQPTRSLSEVSDDDRLEGKNDVTDAGVVMSFGDSQIWASSDAECAPPVSAFEIFRFSRAHLAHIAVSPFLFPVVTFERPLKTDAERVIEIVERLSRSEARETIELTWDRDGSITLRPVSPRELLAKAWVGGIKTEDEMEDGTWKGRPH